MPDRSTSQIADVTEYIRALSMSREDELCRRMREETGKLPLGMMQISAEQGQLMAMFARSHGARRVIEVGVFTGYSALCVARELPEDGVLVACDNSDEWTSLAKPYWEEAGVANRIDLRIGEASNTLAAMIDEGEAGTYDFAFIDADKEGYSGYYEQVLELLRPDGICAFDNMLMGGRVLDPETTDPGPRHIIDLTKQIWSDERVDPVFVPVGDGVVFVRKR